MLFLITCGICFLSCRKKCKKSSYYNLNELLIEIKHDFRVLGTNNPGVNLFVDSSSFYSNFDLSESATGNINFNTNSCIYVSLNYDKSDCAKESIDFNLTDIGAEYELLITYCTKKRCLSKKLDGLVALIKTRKLQNKPIITKF